MSRIQELESEVKRLQDTVRERDRRVMDLESNMQSENLGQLVGIGQNHPEEEQKEHFFRKDPTFHAENTLNFYQGGSVEAVLYLKHGHLAISGSSSNHKLVICTLSEL